MGTGKQLHSVGIFFFLQSHLTPILELLTLLSSSVAFASIVGPSLVNLASILALKLLVSCAETHIFLHSAFSYCLYDSSSRQCQREQPLVKHYAPLQPVNARSQKVASYEVVLDWGLELCTFKEYCAADRP